MSLPDWRTSGSGTRIRAALWLVDAVGEGNSFKKADLRDAFPGVEQIDRRLRDLRDDGWVIATYREDRSLDPDELRFVSRGGPVWEQGYRRPGASAVSAKMRSAVFAADQHTCVVCGVIGGDTFPDDPLRVARLTCQRLPGDDGSLRLRTVCDRCQSGTDRGESEVEVLAAVRMLSDAELDALAAWSARGGRSPRPADLIWARLARLPTEEREVVRATIVDLAGG
jgi:hypothetical protein